MTLTQEQIKKISEKLSKLPNSNTKIAQDLENIIKYFSLLNEVDTDNVFPTYNLISKKNKLREDELEEKKIQPIELLKCSKQKVIANQISINNIMKG